VDVMSSRTGELAGNGVQPEWTLTVVSMTRDGDANPVGLAELDDRSLVQACLDGRTEAFDLIVERHRRHVYRLCRRFVNRHEDAADLSQDVFLRAYRGLRRFRADASLSTWLYRIGVNVCLNKVSARVPPQTSLDDAPPLMAAPDDPTGGLVCAERATKVRAAIGRLPRKQRATLILRIYHDLSHQEIATVLGISVGAAKANLFHALGNVKKLLADQALG
jgi:RNA polymerase sigma-70 factor (ECF subfamily)